MSIDNPWFTTRFSQRDYSTVALLRRDSTGYRTPRFQPVRLNPGGTIWRPDQFVRSGNSGVHDGVAFTVIEVRTARWAFVERAYAAAVAATERRFPDVYDVRWIPCLPNWRELVLPACHADAGDFLEEQLWDVVASGDVHVDLGVDLRSRPQEGRGEVMMCVVIDSDRISEEFVSSVIEQCRSGTTLTIPGGRRAFTIDDVAEFAIRPTQLQLELLNHWEATPPATDSERRMIRAAGGLKLDEMERLIDDGARIDALDEDSETALAAATQTFGEHDAAREAVVRRLIALGADVNLFGYEGFDPLVCATLSAEPVLVELLLAAGADPNHNPWPGDEPDLISAALDYASTDAWLEKGTPKGEAYAEIEQMLELVGAVLRRPDR